MKREEAELFLNKIADFTLMTEDLSLKQLLEMDAFLMNPLYKWSLKPQKFFYIVYRIKKYIIVKSYQKIKPDYDQMK